MNGKLAKRLRKETGYHPADERVYQETMMPGTIEVVREDLASVRKFFGYGILSSAEAAGLGLDELPEGKVYTFQFGPKHYVAEEYRNYKERKNAAA